MVMIPKAKVGPNGGERDFSFKQRFIVYYTGFLDTLPKSISHKDTV